MGIIIGADFVPTQSNMDLFIGGDIQNLFGEQLWTIINNADFRIFNMEIPITSNTVPIQKRGKNLSAPVNSINAYSSAKVDLVTLANNHILDYGEDGLHETMDLLCEHRIKFVGAGKNIDNAAKPVFFSFCEKKIGVYACVQHEYSVASKDQAGANPFDPLYTLDHICDMKQKCDYSIVLYHGGREEYQYPTPYLQKICRRFIEKGADLVICQHSHCIGCEEKYLSGTIVYGQGNFLFDGKTNELWKSSVLIEIDNDFQIKYIPIMKVNHVVRLADAETRDAILQGFKKRSEEIKDDSTIRELFDNLAHDNFYDLLWHITGQETMIFKILNKISFGRLRYYTLKRKYNERYLFILENTLLCEPHFELLIQSIDNAKNKSKHWKLRD